MFAGRDERIELTSGADARGQRALRRRLRVDSDQHYRSVTGAVLWSVGAAIGALQQYGPAGDSLPGLQFSVYLGFTILMAALCLIVGPRLSELGFRRAEDVVVVLGWFATGALVAFTGGAVSPDLALFASVVFYCAYFMEPRRAALHVLLGTALLWAPAIYDFQAVASEGFLARALVMTAVLWATALLVARNRQSTIAAELRARRLALTDPLTGVANLHTFGDEMRLAIAQADEHGANLGVAFVDVNGLKAANTVHGHAGGDQLIRRTADALTAACGAEDQVARIGGDEFAVLVDSADAARMKLFAADFAVALAAEQADDEGSVFELSASIGTAVFPQDGETFDRLMDVADERMYDSKAALPPRFPTPGTSGGRRLSGSEEQIETTGRELGGVPATAFAWLLAGALIAATAVFPDGSGHPRMALAIGGICVAVAGLFGLIDGTGRAGVERAGGILALVLALPVLYATGGISTPLLPLAYLVVAHAAYALSAREALLRAGVMIGVLLAVLAANFRTQDFGEVSVTVGEALVLAVLLRHSRTRAIAAERAALKLSRTDALTGLANRRVFERTLAIAEQIPIDSVEYDHGGLIFADVDNFKTINTVGGHKGGDEVLKMIAAVLDGAVGREATVCRIGGDEFAVIVPDGDASAVMRTAAKCRAAIGAVDWHVLTEADVTISMGYATWEFVDTWKDLVIAADLALQASKDAGRDCVSGPSEHQVQARRVGPEEDPGSILAG